MQQGDLYLFIFIAGLHSREIVEQCRIGESKKSKNVDIVDTTPFVFVDDSLFFVKVIHQRMSKT